MTQADIPAWSLTFQLKLMAALDAAWALIETTDDPALIRRARDKARAVGELAAMARKVALIAPNGRKPPVEAAAAGLHAAQGLADLSAMLATAKVAETPRAPRPLDRLKGGGRGRL